MGFDLDIQVEEWTNEDRSWLGSRLGTQENKPVTLDLSLFDFEGTFTDLVIPSGTALGGPTVDDTYGPYDSGASDGTEDAAGLLFNTQPMVGDGTALVGVPLFWYGRVVEDKLPDDSGVDAGFKTDVPTLHFE